jgi:hypothetical protein
MRWTAHAIRPIVICTASRARCLRRASSSASAVDRCIGERSACGGIAGPLTREARFLRTQKIDRDGEVGWRRRMQDKANFVRASLRLQEVVCTLFLATRSYPTSEARRRFFRFFIAINVPRDGGSPLLRQSTQIQSAVDRSSECVARILRKPISCGWQSMIDRACAVRLEIC